MNKQIFNLTNEEQLLTDKLSTIIVEEIDKNKTRIDIECEYKRGNKQEKQ